GITDMVRISDARMSGTAYGTVVLHVAPEAAAGGPLAAVRDGDWIELDCAGGRLHLDIADDELARRLADLQSSAGVPDPATGKPVRAPVRKGGYEGLYIEHVLQADEGCDFDFLVGCRGAAVPRHSH
ncbi:MAG: dihydroxy-acid dehydratase, partial [Gammaproteobacteria bacterium]|nr:dihydroxy-acid dehydratase [Gammaproteobacteria bacterium]